MLTRLEAGFGRSPFPHADIWHAVPGAEVDIVDQTTGARVGILDVYENGEVVYQTDAITLEVHGTTDITPLPNEGVIFALPSRKPHEVTLFKVPRSGSPTLTQVEEEGSLSGSSHLTS